MAYFLLTYDRAAGELLAETPYDDHAAALADRFRREQDHASQPDVEVVVLAADSSHDLRRTHARYFKSLRELADDALMPRETPLPAR